MLRRIGAILVATICVLTLCMGCGNAAEIDEKADMRHISPEVKECLAKGHQAAQVKDLETAIKEFSACVKKYPDSAAAHFFLGMAYFRKKNLDNAVEALKKSAQLDPKNLNVPAVLGKIYSMDKDKLSVAEELLARVIKAAPHNSEVRFDLARVYARQGKIVKAVEQFNGIFAQEPKFAVYHTGFAQLLMSAGKKKEAQTHLLRARALAPDAEVPKKLLEALDSAKIPSPSQPEDVVKKP